MILSPLLLAAGLASAQEAPLTPEDCAMRVHPPEHVAMMRNVSLDEAKAFLERAAKECASAPADAEAPAPRRSMGAALGDYGMNRDASGTSWQPEAGGMGGLMAMKRGWHVMEHGFLNFGFDGQGGPRGGSAPVATSMAMASAARPAAGGELTLRAMGSADPLLAPRGYPLLFQSDEGYRDRQHPHDLFMELSATYTRPVGEKASAFVYAGLPGEPALGPSVFMHRASGEDLPQAPLAHHTMDSTHVTYGVVTGGVVLGKVKLDASAFNGREPDDKRLGIETGKLDSRSARVTVNPDSHWSLQASAGHLAAPEPSEPGLSMDRVTASASYAGELGGKLLAATAVWGRNILSTGETLDAALGEATLKLSRATEVFGRFERVEKEGLGAGGGPAPVKEWTAGAARDLAKIGPVRYGVGVSASVASAPAAARPEYGAHPASALVWLRAKLGD